MKHKKSYRHSGDILEKSLRWADTFSYCCLFNNNNILKYPFKPFNNLLAVGSKNIISNAEGSFESLQRAISKGKWLIGHLSYDLKNQIETLKSTHPPSIDFPLLQFFVADHLIHFEKEHVVIESDSDPDHIFQQIVDYNLQHDGDNYIGSITKSTTKKYYLEVVEKLLQHIIEGDIYEINYCIEFIISKLKIDPVSFYLQLCNISPTPFSSFYKIKSKYALGASPERFLKKDGNILISQPIKGTAKRGADTKEDDVIKTNLFNDEKERAENMMIVDLVRNDLARSAISGTVKVEEMFGIYSFQHWHQMISTVSAKVNKDSSIISIVKNAFPMGSMTGAPKVKVMQLIEQYETFKRGLYSGAIGYITPNGDFDFSVVIRTLFYDNVENKGSFMVGSAITSDAKPENEYEECILKIKPLLRALAQHTHTNEVDFSIKDY